MNNIIEGSLVNVRSKFHGYDLYFLLFPHKFIFGPFEKQKGEYLLKFKEEIYRKEIISRQYNQTDLPFVYESGPHVSIDLIAREFRKKPIITGTKNYSIEFLNELEEKIMEYQKALDAITCMRNDLNQINFSLFNISSK